MIEELSTLLGIDIGGIKADVQEQIRFERAPKDPAVAHLAAQPEGSAKGEKSKSKPAAPAKKGKTSKEEAAANIASALQELDADTEEVQAPDGAGLVEGAALAAPGGTTALPQVGDRVAVNHEGDADHEREGVVLHVLASGKARVQFDGNDEGTLLPIGWLNVITTSLWPFPRTAEQAAPSHAPAIKVGDRVKVKGTMASGFLSDFIGKQGVVKSAVEGTTKWVVNMAKPKKASKLIEFEVDMLEVLE